MESERDALLRVAALVAEANDLEGVLELVAEEARRAVGAASLSISRLEGGRVYRSLINVGELAPSEERFPKDETYGVDRFPRLLHMCETGKPYFNSLDDPYCDPAAAELLRSHGKTSDLGVAIEIEGQTWGGIWATTDSLASSFDSKDLRFLEAIAGQLANVIARAELFSRVSRLAYEDALTGLANRRALEERLDRALARFARDGTSLTLLLCDVDGLKAINDAHGHGEGDTALKATADALVAATADHPGAFVARLGGDEFCVLLELRGAPGEGRGSSTVERVATAAQTILASRDLRATLSCGAATAGPRVNTPSALLGAADTAQYMAKRRGGNRTCTTAQVAEATDGTSAPPSLSTPAERVAAATEEVLEALDGELHGAPVLDRLEAVAAAYTEAGSFARWAISYAAHGGTGLRDVSLGENRRRRAGGVRVTAGFEQYERYELDDYPETARIIAAGTGSFLARLDDPETDPAELAALEQEGFAGILGVAVGDSDGVYLIELASDERNAPLTEVEPLLRLAARAAVPPLPHHRDASPLTSAHSRALELTLALAERLAAASGEHEVCEAAVEELQRAFGSTVVHIVAIRAEQFEVCAERGPTKIAPGWTQPVGTGLLGRCVREGSPVISGDVQREPQYRVTDATREVRSELAVPIVVAGAAWGAVNLEDTELEAFSADDARLLESVAAQMGGAIYAIGLCESLDRAYVGTAKALSAVLDAKDSNTAEHSRSIAENAAVVGQLLGMDDEQIRLLRYGATFHDIGKLAVSKEILSKPGPLTTKERRGVEEQTVIGERILEPIEFLAPIRPTVRAAHERWDGAGYPDGLAGEEIPLGARILFACEAYEAMTTDRAYRPAMPDNVARDELRACVGSQFDPDVVEALLSVLEAESEAEA